MTDTQITKFMRLLRELQKIDPEFPLQYAVCLAEIARSEGASVTELSEKTGLALSTTSRIVGALSKKRQKGTPFDLIKIKTPPEERRRKELHLTTKGKAVMTSIAEIFN